MDNASTLDEVDLNHLLALVQDRIKLIDRSHTSKYLVDQPYLSREAERGVYLSLEEKILWMLDGGQDGLHGKHCGPACPRHEGGLCDLAVQSSTLK